MGAHSSCSSMRLLVPAQNVNRLRKNKEPKKEKGYLWQKWSLHKVERSKDELERTIWHPWSMRKCQVRERKIARSISEGLAAKEVS